MLSLLTTWLEGSRQWALQIQAGGKALEYFSPSGGGAWIPYNSPLAVLACERCMRWP
jgi:hypothetical protein